MHYKEKKETGDSYVGFGASGVGIGAAIFFLNFQSGCSYPPGRLISTNVHVLKGWP